MSKKTARPNRAAPKPPAPAAPKPPAAPAPLPKWLRWKWAAILLLVVGVGSAGAVLAVVLLRPGTPSPFDPLAQPAPSPMVMVRVPGGTFHMGTTEHHPHFADAPEHEV